MARIIICISLIVAAALTSCRPEQPEAPALQDSFPWWNDTVFYEIFVRSFYDSDGDGVGDFKGIIDKLDYLNDGNPETTTDLGITGIWLMPIFPSPSYHGYDVTDYYAVNPEYGSMEDFQNLVAEAHQRGIRVLIDLVLNHTSDQHPWFKAACQDPESEYRDWYIWSEEDPGYRGPWNQEVWHPCGGTYYYGLFVPAMPDLNYLNQDVTDEMNEIVRFWLEDVGVDGFRLDAAKHLIEKGKLQENTPATHNWFKDFRPAYKSINPDALMIGEVYDSNLNLVKAYTDEELDLVFNFGLAGKFLDSARSELGLPLLGEMNQVLRSLPEMQYATFLTNHDQNRVMTQLNGNTDHAKTAAALLLTSPGVPIIYYGEEIGMQGQKPDEDIRRPMQWSSEENGGFTTGQPWRNPDPSYNTVNVTAQAEVPDSLFNLYRSLIHFRMDHPALSVGQTILAQTANAKLHALLRVSQEEALLVLINTSGEAVEKYSLGATNTGLPPGAYRLLSVFGPDLALDLEIDASGSFSTMPAFAVPPYTTIILAIESSE